jgi:MFS transporter, PHS family, inorganic phosphate transporter
MLCGCFTTLLIPETKRKTLEQLAGEVPGTPEYDPKLAVNRGMAGSERGSDEVAKEEQLAGEKV